ncbi:ribose-5-phosphate isomerase RpiA [Mangrovicoccus algicola]|uniref:Ribose-5-phosphate isomerase A n=1 Tax=Mangrovicoccus algicola TaxID=2771008 RepID=A0A8J7CJ74_9RHOB|nr:ribose-5-phosphate isomerase RpiA [Mangrovicoccus algicola]MBE3640470.1 ribose-5-phosphate isomerase RpiA [Mangrovicoccus algicola]
MTETLSPAEAGKFAAAMASVAEIEDGMTVGLGTGSTAAWMVRALARRAREDGLRLTCVPTSDRTAGLARALGLTVVGLDEVDRIDVTIDGADEFDGHLRLIKGGGAAHLREKLVAAASDRMIVITDPSKDVETLGAFPLPIEVIPMGWKGTEARIRAVLETAEVDGRDTALRMAEGKPVITDEGNYVIDAHLGRIGDPEGLAAALADIPGVVEHGLFIGLCDTVIIGHPDGRHETRMHDQTPAWGDVIMELAALLPTA